MKSKFARLRFAAVVSIVCLFCTAFAHADASYRSFSVSWTPPTQNVDGSPVTDLLGYYIYSGSSPDALIPTFFAPSGSSSIELLYPDVGTYYFAMTAVNSDGVESAMTGTVNSDGP